MINFEGPIVVANSFYGPFFVQIHFTAHLECMLFCGPLGMHVILRPLGVQNLFCGHLECKIYFAAHLECMLFCFAVDDNGPFFENAPEQACEVIFRQHLKGRIQTQGK